jgi:hypothetical protein
MHSRLDSIAKAMRKGLGKIIIKSSISIGKDRHQACSMMGKDDAKGAYFQKYLDAK